jgi:chorismate mutase
MIVRNVRAIRGAITVEADNPESIRDATQELLDELLQANSIVRDDVISATFTMTADLRSEFPVHGARLLGWTSIPMICAQEADVEGALPRCIRVMLHAYTWRMQDALKNVYLRDAIMLSPGLASD